MSAGRRPISAPLTRGARACERGVQEGFTYLALLIAVAVGGSVLAAIGEFSSHAQQREKEAELLFAGHQYRQAIAAYYERSPGAKRFPQKLEELLEDKRYPNAQRYLRKLYSDPAAGKAEWGLMEAPGGGIMGVYSLAELHPIKSGGFSREDESFADAASYADWKFFYTPPNPSATADPGPAPTESSGTPPADAAATPPANPAAAPSANPAAAASANSPAGVPKAPAPAPARPK